MRRVALPKMLRFQFLYFNNQVTIRTFNKEIYILKSGLIVQNVETSQLRRIQEIYYDIRTVRTINGEIVAKRKNRNSELYMQKIS
ncbi:hypothetical protein [Lederbergia lenta]|uniref:hypothetical protein n=1 Tax=Lederbergia lenta TaxID=1467 RepID=UPI00203FC4D4|nr:hypothetical protein [Lederbergia lenta]MCM3113588.1 hypothetical protein [Lederbergia lenta]